MSRTAMSCANPVKIEVSLVSSSTLVYDGLGTSAHAPRPSATRTLPACGAGDSVTSVRSPSVVVAFLGIHFRVAKS